MAEDIDIEEHDLLQNPIIKQIFPDLSVLKQEIMDFDEGLPKEEENLKETDNKDLAYEYKNLTAMNTSDSSNDALSFRQILGSKCNKVKKTFSKDVKVVLQNIRPYLTRTKRFCEMCLILYQSKGNLNDHKQSVHPSLEYNLEHDPLHNKNKKYKCSICGAEFANNVYLKKHERNIHFISFQSRKEIPGKCRITEANVMVNINQNTCSFKACSHCNMIFPTQLDLIDHMYKVLHAQPNKTQVVPEIIQKRVTSKYTTELNNINDQFSQNNIAIILENETENKTEPSIVKNTYCCPICSYYFSEEKFCKSHVIVKHKAMKNMHIVKVPFNPICKFCHLKYADILSYNTHLRKSHKFEMIKPVNSVLTSNNIEAMKGITDNSTLKTLKQSSIINRYPTHIQFLKSMCTDIQVVILKIILYKCSECHVYFLTPEAATKHIEHSNLKKNWVCKNCDRLFKEKDADSHQKQHACSKYFSIMNVFAEIKFRELYKCSLCAVHYSKENFFEHCNICESEQPQSSYCRECDIFVDSKIEICHKNDHKLRNMVPSDFKIMDLNSEYPVQNNENNKCCLKDDHGPKPTSTSNSTYFVDLINPTRAIINNKHNNVINIEPKYFAGYPKAQLLRFNYCHVCKCNICKVHKADCHVKLNCVNTIKYVCKNCGLLFTKKSMNLHRRLHNKYKSLKLQDFTFYNLKTKKIMIPLIPEYPKCEFCEIHFISNVHVKRHICDKSNYLVCYICKEKFSKKAYKLHKPFHNYKLKSKIENSSEQINKIKLSGDLQETNESVLISDSKLSADMSVPAIYTCKNCNLSVNVYDELVEHCHLHTNLNKVEVNGVTCTICQTNFDTSCYDKHLQLHNDFQNEKIMRFSFDIFNFGLHNDKWLKHIFKSLSKIQVNKFIENSVYKHETRIKMAVVQEGPSHLITIYKCEKCQCVVDYNSTYTHVLNCCPNAETSDCSFCDLTFVSSRTRKNHEKIHAIPDITLKSYKIVIFNREQDRNINFNISNLKKYYVVYECRYCHVLVENYSYNYHLCHDVCKKCNICGLLLSTVNIDDHILKHKLISSFIENKIKVVLLGNRTDENNILQTNNDLVPTFNGIVCDYTFYKCVNCEICVRDERNSVQHSCLIDAAKSQCTQCDLIFDEGKLKGHLKLHDTDPDFTKENIMVKPFDNHRLGKNVSESIELHKVIETDKSVEKKYDSITHITSVIEPKTINASTNISTELTAKLYKCSCGLHYIQQSSLEEHMKKCFGKIKPKQSIQNCFKCGLTFTSDILFKHLLEHHGDKNIVFQYEIIQNPP